MARNKHPEETVNLILDVALALFFEKGYDNTSIQDIIDGLGGLTKGAVYHHFKSKEDILSAALDRDNQALFDELRRIRDDGRMTGAEKLQALFAASITGPQMDMWAKAAPDVDPVKNARLLGLQYQAVLQETVPDFVLPIVEQGVRDGSIQTDRPREFSEVIVLLANLWVSPMFRSATAEELRYRVLWKRFYKTIAIAARENPRCRMTHCPKRYWENMLEMEDELRRTPDSLEALPAAAPALLPQKEGHYGAQYSFPRLP